jgi:hypothetical protein
LKNIEPLTWTDIWDLDFHKGLFFGLQVAEAVNEGMHLVLLLLICIVEDEV